MSESLQKRNYAFHGLDLRVLCPEPIAEALDSRFRLVPFCEEDRKVIEIGFQSVAGGGEHSLLRPSGDGRAFYDLPSGEACYFAETDEVYMSFGDGVRALAKPGLGSASFSFVPTDPVNVFMASHLMFTILLVEIMKRRGCYSMHAAAFSRDGKAVLIAGTSGAGKSTLAVTLLRSGFGYLSDDMLFLRRRNDRLAVLGFPEDVDVSDRTIGFFPELNFLAQSPKTPGWPKKQVRVDEVYGSELLCEAKPGAILIPRISGKETSVVRPIGADEALLEIVSNVLLSEARSCQEHLNVLGELVRETPCYRLETGRDFEHIPMLLRDILSATREEIHV
jgi:hypothetical protein